MSYLVHKCSMLQQSLDKAQSRIESVAREWFHAGYKAGLQAGISESWSDDSEEHAWKKTLAAVEDTT